MKRILSLIIIILAIAAADDFNNLKNDVTFLSSETCFGRSLSKDGIFKAEKYIKKELKKAGLKVKTQSVKYGVNQTLATPVCVINGDTLEPAYDFIPHPYSTSVNKHFDKQNIEIADSTVLVEVKEKHDLPSSSSARRFLIKKSTKKDRNTLLLFTGSYPLMSKQDKQYERPSIQVDKKVMPEELTSVYVYNKVKNKIVWTNNVIAVIEGSKEPEKAICLSAHYDHMGALGDIYYPGANDNASGVTVLLELARYFSENPPPVTVVFCFFTGEEQGLQGSWRYIRDPAVRLKNTMMVINLDMVGSGLDGYGIVGGNDHPEDVSIFEDIREEYGFGNLKLRPNAANSDHFPFTVKGVPALFFYASGGEQPYHHPDDIPETLDWNAIQNTVVMVREYIIRKANL